MLADLALDLKRDHDVSVYCLTRLGPVADELLARGVPVRCLRVRGWPSLSALWSLLRAARRADVVHTHLFYSDLLGAVLRVLGARALVSTRHETGYWMRHWHRMV